MEKEPLFEVAQLAHCEILSPKPAETVRFFTELLGLTKSGRAGLSVYLRAFEDFYHHTLKVTEAREPGLGHVAWRATSTLGPGTPCQGPAGERRRHGLGGERPWARACVSFHHA